MAKLSLKSLRRAWRDAQLARKLLPLGMPEEGAPSQPMRAPQLDPLAPLTKLAPLTLPSPPRQRVLIAGVYLADRENTAAHITERLTQSTHDVTQRWIALRLNGEGTTNLPGTQRIQDGPAPRFALLNELTADRADFDWVIITDDDVELCENFLDRLLAITTHCNLALSQPARTPGSYIDLPLMRRAPGLIARRTRFVEIGPMVCIRKDAVPHILPFDETSGMGWGADFTWPVKLEAAGLHLGVIDAAPIAHRIRPTVQTYSRQRAEEGAAAFLASTPHLTREQAFTVLEAYAGA